MPVRRRPVVPLTHALWPIVAALLAVGTGCGEPPVVTAAEPALLRPGTVLTVSGERFAEPTVLALRQLLEDGQGPATWSDTRTVPATVLDAGHVEATLPADLPVGTWFIGVGPELAVGPDGPAVPTAHVVVWTPDTDPPCAKHHALDVQTSRTKRTLTVRRIVPDGEPEALVLSADDLDGLLVGGDATCAWIKATQPGGEAVLLFDEAGAEARAQEIAAALAGVLDLPVRQP